MSNESLSTTAGLTSFRMIKVTFFQRGIYVKAMFFVVVFRKEDLGSEDECTVNRLERPGRNSLVVCHVSSGTPVNLRGEITDHAEF